MFESLKKLFGKLPQITVEGFREPEILYTTEAPLEPGKHDVRALIEGEEIRASIEVIEPGRATFLGPVQAIPYLRGIFGDSQQEKRAARRLERVLRVISRAFPGYQGRSRDISKSGIRVETGGPVVEGQFITLSIELDADVRGALELEAEVRWCAPKPESGVYVAGLKFAGMDARQRMALNQFLEDIDSIEAGVIPDKYRGLLDR